MGLIGVSGRILRGAFFALLAFHLASCKASGGLPHLGQLYEEVEALIEDGPYEVGQVTEIVRGYYRKFVGSGGVSQMSNDELIRLLSGLELVVDELQGQIYAQELVAVTQELYTRDERLWKAPHAPYGRAQSVYGILISARKFDLADTLHAALPAHIEPFPYGRIVAGELDGSPAIVVAAEQRDRLDVRPVALQRGPALVGVVHTGCAFSRDAMSYLEQHAEEFESLFPDNVVWVASQGVTPIIPHLERWNAKAKLIKVHVAWKDTDWPQDLDLRRTPGFYLLKDGAVIDSVIGWPNDTAGQALRKMLLRFEMDHDAPD